MKGSAAGRIGIVAATLLLAACTVMDLDADGKPIMPKDPHAKPGYSNHNQRPQQIAESVWASRVQQRAEQQALSWADMETKSHTLKAGSSESVFVRAGGTVAAFDNQNARELQLTVTINGKPVPIGPVLHSNTIRDAAGFRFEEFTNQAQYAQLTKALNRHAVKQLPPVDASWVGKPVQVLLAVSMTPDKVDDVVAIQLQQGNP